MLEEFAENHRIPDVRHEELVETKHPGIRRETVGDRLQGVGAALEVSQLGVYSLHEPVEVESALPGNGQRLVEQIHQVGLAATDVTPEVQSRDPPRPAGPTPGAATSRGASLPR